MWGSRGRRRTGRHFGGRAVFLWRRRHVVPNVASSLLLLLLLDLITRGSSIYGTGPVVDRYGFFGEDV